MTDTRTAARHTFERTIAAEIEDVWRALTDPDERQQSHYDFVLDSTLMPGEPLRWRSDDDEVLMEGTVVDVDPPHRLVHTVAITEAGAAGAAADAPSRATITLEPDDEGTRVSVVHDGFDSRNATWRAAEDRWDDLLDALTGLLDEDG